MTHPHEGLQERALREVLDAACDGLVDEVAGMIGADQRQRIALSYAEAEMRNRLASLSLPQQAVTDEGETAWLTRRVAEVVEEDGGCWTACSGCQESVDGYVSSKYYPYSRLFKCQPGSGCRECGGLGVIWQDGEFLAGYGEVLSTPTSQPPAAETRRGAAIAAVAKIEMDREGYPLSRTQEEIYTDAAETVDAVLAALTQPEPTAQQGGDADVMIGQFIAQYDEGAAGCLMDADDAHALAREFKRMRGLIYCPGVLRCAKCDFRLIKTTLTPNGASVNEEPDTCPNCNVPMWRVTWQDEAKDAYKTAESQMDRALEAEKALSAQQAAGEAEAVGRARKLYEAVEAGQFDALDAAADKWVEEAGVQRMSNAIASVFEKYASQEIMDRFREKITALIHLAFVEGAGQGVIQSAPLYTTPQPTETPIKRIEDGHADTEGEAAERFAHLNCPACGGSGHIDDVQPTETQRIVAAGGEREGPAPIPNTRLQCFGCKHLDTEDWREPSGDGETFDSGTSARCKAIPTEHGGQVIGSYWSRTNDAPKWCPFLPANPASGEHLAGEEQ